MGECSNGMTLHRYSMLINFIVEGFAEGDGVSGAILGLENLGTVRSKPKVDAVEKMKTRGIDQGIAFGMVMRPEEDRR
jgi:hypothetical protein